MIPGASPRSCMFKFVSLKKFKLAQHKWQKEEENLLFSIIEYFRPYIDKSEHLTGNQLHKNYTTGVPRSASSGLPSSAGSTGAATSIPRSRRGLGRGKRTKNCYRLFLTAIVRKGGQPSSSSFWGELRMPLKTGSICCSRNRRK